MSTAPRRTRWLAVPAALLLATVVAGCGSSTKPVANAQGGGSSGVTLHVGIISANGKWSGPTGQANSTGKLLEALKAAGVTKIEPASFPNGPDLNTALKGGSIDIAEVGDTPALLGKATGLDTRLIAQGRTNLDVVIFSRKGGPASVDELAGKKVSTQTGSYMYRYLLADLAAKNIKATVSHLYVTDAVAALTKGDIDAYAAPLANAPLFEKAGFTAIEQGSKAHPDFLGTTAIVATGAFLKAHPDIVKAYVAARGQAVTDAKANESGFYDFEATATGFPRTNFPRVEPLADYDPNAFTDHGWALLTGTDAFLADQKIAPSKVDLDAWKYTAP